MDSVLVGALRWAPQMSFRDMYLYNVFPNEGNLFQPRHILCYKLDNTSASVMRRRHQISNTKFSDDW